MAFDYDETNPLGSMFIAAFPDNEVAHRTQVLGSVNADHYAEANGYHRQVTLPFLATKPTTQSTAGFIYTKEIDNITELFYENEDGTETQLTSAGSASPDKLPLAGGTMTGPLVLEATTVTVNDGAILPTGTTLIQLLNAKGIQGRNAADAAWENLIQVDAQDVCEIGDQALDGGLRLNADGADAAVVAYGDGDKKIYHAGNSGDLIIPPFISGDQTIVDGAQGSVAHTANAVPKLWTAHMRCTTIDVGYAVGDVVPLGHAAAGATGRDIGVWVNSTHFGWSVANSQIRLMEKDSFLETNIIYANWALVFYAWY